MIFNFFKKDLKNAIEKEENKGESEVIVDQLKKDLEKENLDQKSINKLISQLEQAQKNNEIFPEKSKENWWKRLKNTYEGFKNFSKKTLKIGMMVAALNFLTPAPVGSQEKPEKENLKVPTPSEILELEQKTEKQTEKSSFFEGWRLNWILTEKNEKGETVFNPLALITLSPIQIEKENIKKEEILIKFYVPYEYARLFNTAQPLRSEDYQKIQSYIFKQYQKTLKDKLSVLNLSQETQRQLRDYERLYRLNKLETKGYASPEGPQEEGFQTLKKVDQKNIDLAKLRAEHALQLSKEALENIGIPKEQINKVLENVEAHELQFTAEEWYNLALLSKDYPGNLVIEKIFNMIVDYNDNKIEDPETVKKLHEILASKRKIEITTEFEGDEKTIYTIPIPLLGFFPLIIRRLWRKRKEEKENDQEQNLVKKEPEKEKSESEIKEEINKEEESVSQETIPVFEDQSFQTISESDLELKQEENRPEFIKVEPFNIKPEDDLQFPEKVKIALCDDLYVYFDRPDTIEKGLDYRKVCDEMFYNFDRFESDFDRENYIARKLLVLWREHDIKCRREAGWREEGIDWGLDYENQPNQILWALAHAKVILRLVKEKKEADLNNEKKDYLDLMARDVEIYLSKQLEEKDNEKEEKVQEVKKLKTAIELAMEGKIAWESEKVVFND